MNSAHETWLIHSTRACSGAALVNVAIRCTRIGLAIEGYGGDVFGILPTQLVLELTDPPHGLDVVVVKEAVFK